VESAADTSFKKFEIGIAEIDGQHRRLFELLVEMRSWSRSELEHLAVRDILNELADYATTHFSVEESLMRMLRYPHTEAHIADHKRFINRLNIFRYQLLKEGDVGDVDLIDFIQSWLVEHIDRADRAYVEHFLAKGIDPHPFP
jgi:hemerythrin